MVQKLDPRLNAYRRDLADARLEGQVVADRFVEPSSAWVTAAPSAPLRRKSDLQCPFETELLYGERIAVLDIDDEGWAWVQARRDSYVGYCRVDAIKAGEPGPATHFLKAARSQTYDEPVLKLPPGKFLTMGAELRIDKVEGKYAKLKEGGYVYAAHVRPCDEYETDPAGVASRFVETPYVWGGKSALGLDCSALVQLSLQACGFDCPRDTDMMAALDWKSLSPETDTSGLARNDLVFWSGHMGIMVDATNILHANATDMSTRVWNLDELISHIIAIEENHVSRILRPPTLGA